jgi:GntR family transcriptional regulator, rspAB operon transcriptional repressor
MMRSAVKSRSENISRAKEAGPQSLVDAAYEQIKRLITTCRFRPGEYVNESEVSMSLGIGRTPVHQAFDRLRSEGLVEVMPRKGILVKPISLDEVLQIVEVRTLCESYCVRLSAERATAAEIAELTRTLDRAGRVLSKRDSEELMLLDRAFHGLIARSSRNDVLAETLGRLHDRSLRFWIISLNAPGHHQSVHDQHAAILKAIQNRDPDAADQAMRDHIEAFRRNLLQSV